jgi:putative flavoprotein involved in K+ transport
MHMTKIKEKIMMGYWDTLVIGAGQAGLACAYYLKQINEDFLVLDSGSRVGESWRNRWDSLKLFSPARYNTLPGDSLYTTEVTTKDYMADYLERYARKNSIPVSVDVQVCRVTKNDGGFLVSTSKGELRCSRVIVATGNNPLPEIPEFASRLNPDIFQLHSHSYRNPGVFPEGTILVVGAGVSGIEIASELARNGNMVYLSGEPSFVIPKFLFSLGTGVYWQFISRVLTTRTFIGRKAKDGIVAGGAVLPQHVKLMNSLNRVPRVEDVADGLPLLKDGRRLPVSSVVWCTGYRPDFSWIDAPVTLDMRGWPITTRGISECEGLYFAGMPFQFGLTSGLVGGVGRDAHFVVNHIARHRENHVGLQQVASR